MFKISEKPGTECNRIKLSAMWWHVENSVLFSFNTAEEFWDSLSVAICIIIQPIPSELQNVLRKVGLSGSNQINTGDDFKPCLSSLKIVISCGVHAIIGIDLWRGPIQDDPYDFILWYVSKTLYLL